MRLEDCFQLGYILKPHGLKGELMIYLDVDQPDEYNDLESLLLFQRQQLVPFFVEYLAPQPGSKAIIRLEDIDSREKAEKLTGTEVYLPLETLPSLEENQFYFHQVVGYEMLENEAVIGEVTAVIDSGLQDLFEVQAEGYSFLVPIVDEIVLHVDQAAAKIHVKLPEGLLDVYRNE